MDPLNLYLPINTPVLLPNGKMDPVWWKFFVDFAQGISVIDLTTQVTGVLAPIHGGTGANNGSQSLTLSGFSLAVTQTGPSSVTMPTSGTLISTTGFKSKRVTTGSVSGGGTALVTVNWPSAFADTNYTAVASVLDSTGAVASLSVVHIESQLVGSISVRVSNAAAGALTGTIQALALHD